MRVGDIGLINRNHPDQGKSSFYRKFIGPCTMNTEYECKVGGKRTYVLFDNWTQCQMGQVNKWVSLGLPREFFDAQG